jgi:putative hydrolase of the HAD superfamily
VTPGLRGLFFDLYGTLFLPPDPEAARRAWVGACYRELSSRGLEETEQRFTQRLARFWPESTRDAAGLTRFERRIGGVAREMGLELPPADLRAVADATCACWQAMLRLDPDAPRALASASGRRVGLVTNFDHPPHVRSVLRENGLERFFERVIVSDEVGVEKPDPAVMRLALAGTGLRPRETAYVGDSFVDYQAAASAGMRPVLIRRPGQVSGDAPEHLRERYGDPEAALAEAAAQGRLTVIVRLRELETLLTSASP